MGNLGYLYYQLGDHNQAIHYYSRLAQLAGDTEHKRSFSLAYSGLADAHLALGDTQRALDCAQQAEQVAQEIGPGGELGISRNVLGFVWLTLGNAARARAYFEESIPLLEGAEEDEDLERARRGLELALSRLSADSSRTREENVRLTPLECANPGGPPAYAGATRMSFASGCGPSFKSSRCSMPLTLRVPAKNSITRSGCVA